MVVSWFWLVGAVVLSLLPPLVKYRDRRQRGGRHASFLTIFSVAHRGRLRPRRLARRRPHRAAADVVRRRAARPVFALDLGWTTIGDRQRRRIRSGSATSSASPLRHSRRHRSRRPRHRRRPVHRADLRRGAGLGRRRPPRPRRRRRQRAQRRLHGRRRAADRAAAEARPGSVPTLFALIGVANLVGRRRHRPHHAGELAARSSLHRLPRLLPPRGARALENVAKAGDERHHRRSTM